jgi:hypothetical protein
VNDHDWYRIDLRKERQSVRGETWPGRKVVPALRAVNDGVRSRTSGSFRDDRTKSQHEGQLCFDCAYWYAEALADYAGLAVAVLAVGVMFIVIGLVEWTWRFLTKRRVRSLA